ncbi:MAG TPA: hypothetical protein PK281_11515 [Flavobacteriales bacterium]|nr:hypothetical protein [Flavobacteriales bacterium]
MKAIPFSLRASALAAATLLISFSSCRKDSDNDSDTNASKNESVAERYFNELNDISDQAAKTGDLSSFKLAADEGVLLSNCATITFDTSGTVSATNPDTIIIDFGTSCLGNDLKTRSGKIIISTTGRYRDQGTVITITPLNYFVNNNQILGTRTVTNTGNNAQGQPTYTVQVDGSIVLANNGGTITWTASRVRTWTEGFNTPLLFSDDVFSVTGSSNGTKVSGDTWTSQITSPLVHKRSCHQTVSGTLVVTPSNRPQRTVDFGSGDCDNQVTVTINGNTYTINIQ